MGEHDELVSSRQIRTKGHEEVHVNTVDFSPFQVHIAKKVILRDCVFCERLKWKRLE